MFTSEELNLFKKALPGKNFEIFVDKSWGSETVDHRVIIREFLVGYLKSSRYDVSAEELAQLSDLDVIPSFKNLYCSISHTSHFGAVIIADFPVGLDVELRERVQDRILTRVSSTAEISEAPSSAHLWSAKEAIFKSLYWFAQPSVISAITVGGWQKMDSQVETFRLLSPQNFKAPSECLGFCLQNKTATLTFFAFYL